MNDTPTIADDLRDAADAVEVSLLKLQREYRYLAWLLRRAANSEREPIDIDAAREQFEEWITEPPIEQTVERYPDSSDVAWPGKYRAYQVRLAWEAWCEAASIRDGEADAL